MMYDKDLKNALDAIKSNTDSVPAIREDMVYVKGSLRSAHKRMDGLFAQVDELSGKTAKLSERMAVQESFCANFREAQTASISGRYKVKTQWVILLAAILVALIGLLGQWCSPSPQAEPNIQDPLTLPDQPPNP